MECRDELSLLTPENQEKFIQSDAWAECLPENEDALTIFYVVRSQVVVAEIDKDKRIITLSIPAIESAMRMRGIETKDQWDVMNQVMKLFYYFREKESES